MSDPLRPSAPEPADVPLSEREREIRAWAKFGDGRRSLTVHYLLAELDALREKLKQFENPSHWARHCDFKVEERAEAAEARAEDLQGRLTTAEQERDGAYEALRVIQQPHWCQRAADAEARLRDAEQEIAHLKDTRNQVPSPEYLMACLTVELDALKAKLHAAEQERDKLHQQIMNLPCVVPAEHGNQGVRGDAYRAGHRDARQAAAALLSDDAR